MNRRPLPCVVRNLRPIPPTVQLMPGVTLYDHEADTLPLTATRGR